jgi:hypothetical protein
MGDVLFYRMLRSNNRKPKSEALKIKVLCLMLRIGDIHHITVDAAGLIGASQRYRNRIVAIKPVNVTSFQIVIMCAITKAYVLRVCSKLS